MSNQQDTKQKNPNVPNLRFRGYEGSWNKVALCEVANIIGGGTPDTSNPLYWNGDIDWFTPTEVGESKYVNESKRKITYAGLKSSSAKLLPRGSILLSTRASVGLASITTNPQGVTTNQGFQSVVPKRVEDSEFLYYVISNQNTQRELKTKANGSTFPEISNSEVSSIIVSLPPDPKERFEISRFLATIDQRIRLQNKIIEDLISIEKLIIDHVFGQQATDSLSAFISEINERNKAEEPLDVYSVSNRLGFIPQSEQFEDKEIASNNKQHYKIATNSTFAYNPARINVGSIGFYSGQKPVIVSPMYVCFKVHGIDPLVLQQFFSSKAFYKEMSSKLEGSVRQCLTFQGMRSIRFHIPQGDDSAWLTIAKAIHKKRTMEEAILKSFIRQKAYLLSNLFI